MPEQKKITIITPNPSANLQYMALILRTRKEHKG